MSSLQLNISRQAQLFLRCLQKVSISQQQWQQAAQHLERDYLEIQKNLVSLLFLSSLIHFLFV
jgi:hypothetical protein